ncbi:hypothetical protein XarbCFBP8149_13635 [Xanthomonas arboricola]|nr:hypothetical protein XarbCFBP8149_13635 [Xanthomonas arboricola]
MPASHGKRCWKSDHVGQIKRSTEPPLRLTHRSPLLLLTMHTDQPDWSLSAYRRGTLRGMDAA